MKIIAGRGDSVRVFPPSDHFFNYSNGAQRPTSNATRILSRNRRQAGKRKTLEWELTEWQVSSWVHNTPFVLRGLLVVINETSSSGSRPILDRIERSFGLRCTVISTSGCQILWTRALVIFCGRPTAATLSPSPSRCRSVCQCVFWTFWVLCRAYFFRFAPRLKWATSSSSLWSYASFLIWL